MKFKITNPVGGPAAGVSNSLFIDKDTFAELVEEKKDSYNFVFRFRISRKAKQFSNAKIVVTVLEKKAPTISKVVSIPIQAQKQYQPIQGYDISSKNSKFQSLSSGLTKNISANNFSNSLLKQLQLNEKKKVNNETIDLPPKLSKKYFSGLQAQYDYEKKEEYVDKVEVPLPFNLLVEEKFWESYSYTEMLIPAHKPARKKIAGSSSFGINVNDIVERMNHELLSPTMCENDPQVKNLNSESSFKLNKNLTTDYFQHLMYKIPNSSDEKDYPWYLTKSVSKKLDYVVHSCNVQISKKILNNLLVRFDVVDKNTGLTIESKNVDLQLLKHVEAFDYISKTPHVTAQVNSGESNVFNVSVQDQEVPELISSFNFYLKEINAFGNTTDYKLIGSKTNAGKIDLTVYLKHKLGIVRVVPVDYRGKESIKYSDVVIGEGYDAIGSMCIVVSTVINGISVEVYNVPRGTSTLQLFRRTCDYPDAPFALVRTIAYTSSAGNTSASFLDSRGIENNKVYEYCVVAIRNSNSTNSIFAQSTNKKISSIKPNIQSNMVMLRYLSKSDAKKSIDVTLSNAVTNIVNEETIVSFDVATTIPQEKEETILNAIKNQIPDFYSQYLNPFNNPSSPLKEGTNDGLPFFKELIIHEIVRTNLNTGIREVFEMRGDGSFADNDVNRKVTKVMKFNPQHEYVYQVNTYRRNPIELFKNFVANGVDSKGKTWFYSPYKWKNPLAKSGILFPEDPDGVPIVERYESLTAESYGTTASYRTFGTASFTKLTQLNAERIDVNTVKVTWNTTGPASLYDSFMVMKVVNGIKYLVGNSWRKNYIYDDISEKDVGDVYYVVLPVMSDFDIDEPGYTNHLLITPEGVTPLTLIS